MSNYTIQQIADANLIILAAGKRIAEAMTDSSVDGQQLVFNQLAAWGMQGDTVAQEALETAVAANWAAITRGG